MFKFFKKKKQEYELPRGLSSICFEVNQDGTVNILCDWPDFNNDNADKIESVAKFYALGIHALNRGLFEADIIDTLKHHDKNNPYNNLFIHNVLVELINIEKTIREKSPNYKKPVISPLNVFNEETGLA